MRVREPGSLAEPFGLDVVGHKAEDLMARLQGEHPKSAD